MTFYEKPTILNSKSKLVAKVHHESALQNQYKSTLRSPIIVTLGQRNPFDNTLDSLYQEAKKYKTVDEFMNTQGKLLYHGTPEKFDTFNIEMVGKSTDSGMFGEGIYFTDNLKEAQTYSVRNGKIGEVKEVYINLKKPYIINKKSDIPTIKVPDTTIEDLKNSDKNYSVMFTRYLQKQGYDGVIDNLSSVSKQYVVFEPSQIKTKQQLIDIWNKVHGR